MRRSLLVSLVLAFAVFGARDADAQAFKPRGKAPAKTAPTKSAPKKATAKKAKKSTAKKSRFAKEARTEDLTPDEDDAPRKRAPEEADDYVVIEDDDE